MICKYELFMKRKENTELAVSSESKKRNGRGKIIEFVSGQNSAVMEHIPIHTCSSESSRNVSMSQTNAGPGLGDKEKAK